VIPALIRKAVAARRAAAHGEPPIIRAWGSGNATREFLYVDDAAEAILLAAEHYDGAAPINIGSGMETSIRQLVQLIAAQVGVEAQIVWDTSQPDGQPRRCLDISRAEQLFGFRARTSLDDGLRRTIEWWSRRSE
jgi:GDP-L-fucose synthase